jgi:CheY-like chemotaxis protein
LAKSPWKQLDYRKRDLQGAYIMNNLTFLYVEDDPLSREALKVVLQRVMKLEHVYIFEDSTDFLNRVRALPNIPNVVLLDIHVDPYSGFEMLDMLRSDANYQATTIIALTASVMNEEVELLKNSGFDGAIGKPINVASFPDLMKRIVVGETVWHITDI